MSSRFNLIINPAKMLLPTVPESVKKSRAISFLVHRPKTFNDRTAGTCYIIENNVYLYAPAYLFKCLKAVVFLRSTSGSPLQARGLWPQTTRSSYGVGRLTDRFLHPSKSIFETSQVQQQCDITTNKDGGDTKTRK